jgi:hypothetical protein
MPVYPGRKIDSTPGWRVGLLLLAFVVVAVFVDKVTAYVERVLANRHGLLEASRKLKKEIFQLGVVSLLLIAVQVGASQVRDAQQPSQPCCRCCRTGKPPPNLR